MDLRKVVGSRPLIMVGASVILLDSSSRLLLQLRTDNNAWGLPGGSLEMGETLEEVAKRELYEETGLIANNLEFFNLFSGKEFYYKYPHGDEVYNVISTYICTDYSGQLKMDESEAKELHFFHLDRLPSTISPPDFPIIMQFIEKFNLDNKHVLCDSDS
jgi:8-oxo-dGTP pyrophosphatase MutT (NUDIX family)